MSNATNINHTTELTFNVDTSIRDFARFLAHETRSWPLQEWPKPKDEQNGYVSLQTMRERDHPGLAVMMASDGMWIFGSNGLAIGPSIKFELMRLGDTRTRVTTVVQERAVRHAWLFLLKRIGEAYPESGFGPNDENDRQPLQATPGAKPDELYDAVFDKITRRDMTKTEAMGWFFAKAGIEKPDRQARKNFSEAIRRRENKLKRRNG